MVNQELPALVERYLLRCAVEGKSPKTIHSYGQSLRQFLSIITVSDPRAVDTDHIYEYLGRFTHLAPASRHRYFREVRCFFNWLVATDRILQSPFRGLRNVHVPDQIRPVFSPDEIGRLLDVCDTDTAVGLRNQAILLTLLDTGARCSEIIQMSLDDLDLKGGRIRIMHGKGSKQRVVPFANRCRQALARYLAVRGLTPGPLFAAGTGHGNVRPGHGVRAESLRQILTRLATASGVEHVHPHRFRHTFTTWAIQHDARELDVQYLLGHATGHMIRRYSSTYRSEQAALRHAMFSPADQMLRNAP